MKSKTNIQSGLNDNYNDNDAMRKFFLVMISIKYLKNEVLNFKKKKFFAST